MRITRILETSESAGYGATARVSEQLKVASSMPRRIDVRVSDTFARPGPVSPDPTIGVLRAALLTG